MIRGLYIAASGMLTKQAQQENLSNNIANINTPGFKKDKVALKTFEEVLIQNRDRSIGGKNFKNKLGFLDYGVGIDANKTFFNQGIIEETGRSLDFAIDGEGFFTVLNDKNEIKYTRDGRFKINQEGYLVNTSGDRVLGVDANNNTVPIVVENSNIQLDNEGAIKVGTGKVKFMISSFNNANELIKEANNCYTSTAAPGLIDGNIKQNSLERSNVDAIETITEMISIMRSYESSQKVLQQMDETLGKSVNEVGSIK